MNHITSIPSLPPRPADGHKGTFGTLLILGGSTQMIGAPMLAGRSAYRAGCGLVRVAMPQSVLAAALSTLPEAIGLGLTGKTDEDTEALAKAVESADALAVGPGLGQSDEAKPLLKVIAQADKPKVLDADALNLIAADGWPGGMTGTPVLTPHPGEMKRLARLIGREDVPRDDDGRRDIAAAFARKFGCILLLKGLRTVISDGERFFVNDTGDVTLAKAGSGDVLTGLIGSLLAQGMDPFDAAICGAHYHGLAGQHAGETISRRSALASEVAESLGAVMPTDVE